MKPSMTRKAKKVLVMKSLVAEELDNAISGLRCGFSWDESDEGFDYWDAIVEKLLAYRARLARQTRKGAGTMTLQRRKIK